MYGIRAAKLISELYSDNSEMIPPYQHQLVKEIMEENEELYAENLRTSQSANRGDEPQNGSGGENVTSPTSDAKSRVEADDSNDDPELEKDGVDPHDDIDISEKEIMVMQIRHTDKLWNKRCIISYHMERLNRLKNLRWEYGNNLPREIVQNLTKDELEWFTKYNDNLFSYMNALNDGQGLDLTLYMKPPKRLNIRFRCLKDYGHFELNGEARLLKKGGIYYFPLKDCEKLIQQGVLEHDKS